MTAVVQRPPQVLHAPDWLASGLWAAWFAKEERLAHELRCVAAVLARVEARASTVVQHSCKMLSSFSGGTSRVKERCVDLVCARAAAHAGPYKVNGVPLRRVNQAYVIATSTKLDVSKVDVAKVDDAYFARAAAPKETAEDAFFAQTAKVCYALCKCMCHRLPVSYSVCACMLARGVWHACRLWRSAAPLLLPGWCAQRQRCGGGAAAAGEAHGGGAGEGRHSSDCRRAAGRRWAWRRRRGGGSHWRCGAAAAVSDRVTGACTGSSLRAAALHCSLRCCGVLYVCWICRAPACLTPARRTRTRLTRPSSLLWPRQVCWRVTFCVYRACLMRCVVC
jgi:Ribosomal protein L6e